MEAEEYKEVLMFLSRTKSLMNIMTYVHGLAQEASAPWPVELLRRHFASIFPSAPFSFAYFRIQCDRIFSAWPLVRIFSAATTASSAPSRRHTPAARAPPGQHPFACASSPFA
jgi:hypothetical protein